MAIEAGILEGTGIDARPLRTERNFRQIALVWRRSSPREPEFQLLAGTLRQIAREVIPGLRATFQDRSAAPRLGEGKGAAATGPALIG
jgi:LysR family hydrogen peroxide-inducible transcriptional activator